MNDFFGRRFIIFLLFGILLRKVNGTVTASNDILTDRDDIRDLKIQARKLLKKPKPFKEKQKSASDLQMNFMIPDYSKRVRRDPLILKMKTSISKYNDNPDSDEGMEHFGEPGTFVWLQGRQPIYIYGPDCFSRIIRENKEENQMSHIGFFGMFIKFLRNRFKMNKRRKLHSNFSRKLIQKRIKSTQRDLEQKKAKLKARILQSKSQNSKMTLKIRHKKDPISNFLHLKLKRNRSRFPAQIKTMSDDSYIRINSFVRPSLSKYRLVRNPSENSRNVVQAGIKIPPKKYQSKGKKEVKEMELTNNLV